MTSDCTSHDIEPEQAQNEEMGVFRGAFRLVGFPMKGKEACRPNDAATSPRQCLSGRKRLGWVTRVLLFILPRRMQSALGYPVCTGIGRSLSPEISVSPTKPCGKGSKRKQDDLDEEEDNQPTWVEVLTQEELEDDVGSDEDPAYVPSVEETDSEEYCEHNGTGCTDDGTASDVEVAEPQSEPQAVSESAGPEN